MSGKGEGKLDYGNQQFDVEYELWPSPGMPSLGSEDVVIGQSGIIISKDKTPLVKGTARLIKLNKRAVIVVDIKPCENESWKAKVHGVHRRQ